MLYCEGWQGVDWILTAGDTDIDLSFKLWKLPRCHNDKFLDFFFPAHLHELY